MLKHIPTQIVKIFVTLVLDRVRMQNANHKKDFLLQFGNNFGKIRQSKNLSFRSLSHKCDLDYADLNKIEKGKRNITLTSVLELAKGLNIHPRDLFDFNFPLKELDK